VPWHIFHADEIWVAPDKFKTLCGPGGGLFEQCLAVPDCLENHFVLCKMDEEGILLEDFIAW